MKNSELISGQNVQTTDSYFERSGHKLTGQIQRRFTDSVVVLVKDQGGKVKELIDNQILMSVDDLEVKKPSLKKFSSKR